MAKKQAGRNSSGNGNASNNNRSSGDGEQRKTDSKYDGNIHSPLVAYGSILGLLSFCPPFVIFLWYTMVHMDGSVSRFWDFLKQQGLQGFLSIWPKPTLIAWKLIGSYAAFEAALQLLLPGERVVGPVSPQGNHPVYKGS